MNCQPEILNAVLSAAFLSISFGCNISYKPVKFSTDAAAFRNIVSINVEMKSLRWEIFSTPEQSGPIPGPTDYEVVIAEIALAEPMQIAELPAGNSMHVAQESVRPWIEGNFRTMLEKAKSSTIALSGTSACRPLTATLKNNALSISGFVCADKRKLLVYLPVVVRPEF